MPRMSTRLRFEEFGAENQRQEVALLLTIQEVKPRAFSLAQNFEFFFGSIFVFLGKFLCYELGVRKKKGSLA